MWVLVPLLSLITAPVSAAHAQFAPAVHYPAGSWPASVAIGDLDSDQVRDLAVANYYSQNVSVLPNQSPWPCYADCNEDGSVDTLDFLAFLNEFVAGCP